MHLTSNPIAWYAARGAGVAAYILLASVIVVGLLLAGRSTLLPRSRAAVVELHRFGGLVIATFLVVHVGAIAIDSFLPFSVIDLVVPFHARLRPIWMGLGIATAELMLAIGVSNALVRRRKLPYRFWRLLHYLNWVVFVAATAHVMGTGTDRSTRWLMAIVGVSCAAVAGSAAWRATRRSPSWRIVTPVAAVVCAGASVAFAYGPLKVPTRPWNAASFKDRLTGQIDRQSGGNKGIISLSGTATGDQRVFVRVDLLASDRGVDSTSLQVEYLPSGDQCTGEVTKIADDGRGFTGWCALPGALPERRTISGSWGATDSTTLVGILESAPATAQ